MKSGREAYLQYTLMTQILALEIIIENTDTLIKYKQTIPRFDHRKHKHTLKNIK